MSESIVSAFVEFAKSTSCSGGSETAAECDQSFQENVAGIRLALLSETLSLDAERSVRYIRYQQAVLVNLIDQGGHCIKGDPNEQFCSYCKELHGLLQFVYERFPAMFDFDQPAPSLLVKRERERAIEKNRTLAPLLEEMQVSPTLQTLLDYPVRKLAALTEESPVPFRRLHFVALLQSEVEKIVTSPIAEEGVNTALAFMLIHVNYNAHRCLDYFKALTHEAVKENENALQTANKLSLLLKRINQTTLRPNAAYHIHQDTLRSQIEHYILEEMVFLERSGRAPVDTGLEQTPTDKELEKVKMAISVADIACLLRAFKDSNIIQNNVSELLHIFTKRVEARKTSEIGFESIRAKYYHIENTTVHRMKQLMTMLMEHMTKLSTVVSWMIMKGGIHLIPN